MARSFHSAAWHASRFAFLALLLTVACSGLAQGDTWSTGQVITYSQADWATGGSAYLLLASKFDTVYSSDVVAVGQLVGGNVMIFNNPASISSYLPAVGPASSLDATYLNPLTTSAGAFGGEVLALQLNVDFSDAGVTLGSSGISFGDLVIENLSVLPDADGLTVRQILADANTDLGGGISQFDIFELSSVVMGLNGAFDNGTPSVVAQDYLVAPGGTSGGGGGMTPTPEPSSALLFVIGLLGFGMLCYKRRIDRAPS